MRVVSSLRSGAVRLLSAFLLGSCFLLRIIQLIGAIGGGLLFGLFAEAFGFELSNLRLGLIEFGLQLDVSLDRVSMPALPIAHLATQLADLLPQFSILPPQLADFCLQSINCREQRANLSSE